MGETLIHKWLEPQNLTRIQGWARDGLVQEDIARQIGIKYGTMRQWLAKYPEIRTAVEIGRDSADRNVENALYKKAMGYEVEETETTIAVMPDGEKRQQVKKIKRHIPPSDTAMIFWLKNRKPAEWRDRREFEIADIKKMVVVVDDISQLPDGFIDGEVIDDPDKTD